jgi:hypothetical protein
MYQVEWIVENRVMLFRAVGDQTLETVEDGVGRLRGFLDKGTAPIHVISDSRYVGSFPASLSVLKKLMTKHEKAGHTVSVGGNAVSKFVSMMVTRFSGGTPLEFKDTFGDALVFLQRVDTSLPREIDYKDRHPDGITHTGRRLTDE